MQILKTLSTVFITFALHSKNLEKSLNFCLTN
nr:MAG TPA: hypothetical protein [Caudoviricetes sp.]